MAASISLQRLFQTYQHQLELEWQSGSDNPVELVPAAEDEEGNPVVGYFNPIHPNQIQVLGQKELDYLNSLEQDALQRLLQNMDWQDARVLISTRGATIPAALQGFAETKRLAVLKSALPGEKLIEYLRYYLALITAKPTSIHGVFMEVMGMGVLIRGPSGIGKSELALELLSRGHRLIADDVPEFIRLGPDLIQGNCPEMLQGFLEVRGLGVLNIRAMFGETAVLQNERLRLVIEMQILTDPEHYSADRLDTLQHYENILDVDIPVVILPVAAGRNLAVIVEVAVRNHVLRLNGYNATEDFIKRQQKLMHSDDE